MKALIKITSFIICILLLTTCKKYPEGGFIRQTCKNLFGANKVGSKKSWKLKKYEVNGIDSTTLINGINQVKEVTFEMKSLEVSPQAKIIFGFYEYGGGISKSDQQIGTGRIWTLKDTLQCENGFCLRNIFFPEIQNNKWWTINKLTKSELILTKQLNNSYRIILTQ